jgi:hypothetical protein
LKIHQIESRIKEEFINILKEDHILIERTDLTLGECIEKGYFGCVYKGVLSLNKSESEEVAVKTLKTVRLNKDSVIIKKQWNNFKLVLMKKKFSFTNLNN